MSIWSAGRDLNPRLYGFAGRSLGPLGHRRMAAYRSACSPHTHIIKTAVGLLGISVTVRSEPALLAAVGLLGISATVRSER